MQKAFKSTVHSDQQVISRKTMPEAMQEAYNSCDAVPNLERLTKFRHDGKDSLKFYTDPDYFFELWKEKIIAESNEKRRRKKVLRFCPCYTLWIRTSFEIKEFLC